MRIFGGKVFDANHKMYEKDLCFANGVITTSSSGDEFDASGCYVLPGLIDSHIHGAYGVEFRMSDADMTPELDGLSQCGVTSILPALTCEYPDEMKRDAEKIAVMASVNPAKAADCADRGELIEGYRADVIVVDDKFNLKAVFVAGDRVR